MTPDEKIKAIVERVMTAHWDMAMCQCWFCQMGRDAGCGPQERYLRDGFRHKISLFRQIKPFTYEIEEKP